MLQLPGGISFSSFGIWDIALIIFVIQPAVNLLCLMGHVFFIKLFKYRITFLKMGKGEPVIKIGSLNITLCYFQMCYYRYALDYYGNDAVGDTANKIILINLGGIVSNSITLLFLLITMCNGIICSNKYLYEVFFVLIYTIVSNMIPYTSEGLDSPVIAIKKILKEKKHRKNLSVEETIKEFDEKIQLKPEAIELYNGKGNVFCQCGRTEEAIKCYLQAIEIRPEDGISYYNMACAYSMENKKNEAIAYLKKAIELKPSCRDGAKKDKDFDNIRNSIEFQKLIER